MNTAKYQQLRLLPYRPKLPQNSNSNNIYLNACSVGISGSSPITSRILQYQPISKHAVAREQRVRDVAQFSEVNISAMDYSAIDSQRLVLASVLSYRQPPCNSFIRSLQISYLCSTETKVATKIEPACKKACSPRKMARELQQTIIRADISPHSPTFMAAQFYDRLEIDVLPTMRGRRWF